MVSLGRLLGILWLLTGLNAWAELPSRLERDRLTQGEVVQLVIDVSSVAASQIDLQPLQQDFEVLGRSRQSRTLIRNGRIERSEELLISLAPKRSGALQVPPLTIDGEQTRALTLQVEASMPVAAEAGGIELRSSLSSQQPRVQQPLIYQAQILIGQPLYNAALSGPTVRAGKALVEPLGEQQQYRSRRNGSEITVVEQAYLITPEQSGPLEIAPATLSGQVRQSGGAGRSRPDPLANSLFADPQALRRIQLSAEGYPLEVRPIPAEYSARYWLPAQTLSLSEHWSSAEARVGEPLTRTLELQVEGLAQSQLPQLSLPELPGLKQYAASPVIEQQYRDGKLVSRLRLELTLIPARAGRLELPAIRVPWWNSRSDSAAEAVLAARVLEVAPGVAAPPPVTPRPPQAAAAEAATPSPRVTQPGASEAVTAPLPDQAPLAWWQAALLGGVAGALLTALAGRWLWRRASSRSKPLPVVDPRQPGSGTEDQWLQAVKSACDAGDANAARMAMLAWGQARWPDITHLNQVAERSSEGVRSAMAEMNRCCYGPGKGAWQGARLWHGLQAFTRAAAPDQTAVLERLKPLYEVQ